MAQFKAQTTNTNNVWDDKKRYKVNSVVYHNDCLYQNVNGINTEPGTDSNWILLNVSNVLDVFIPLSGTTVGNPVTGDINISNGSTFIYSGDNLTNLFSGIKFNSDDLLTEIISSNDDSGSVIGIDAIAAYVGSTNPLSKGLIGLNDFTPNITDLDYVQKIYVDGLRGKHISKTNTEILAISSPQNGETYFNTTISTLCFYDGTGWRKVSHSAM